MSKIIAYCGLVCSECPAFIGTQANDRAALERVATEWREAFNLPDLTADSVVCDGCVGHNGGRLSSYCATCPIRACAVERDVVNCAHCADYACEELEGFFAHVTEARAMLDEIRAGL